MPRGTLKFLILKIIIYAETDHDVGYHFLQQEFSYLDLITYAHLQVACFTMQSRTTYNKMSW